VCAPFVYPICHYFHYFVVLLSSVLTVASIDGHLPLLAACHCSLLLLSKIVIVLTWQINYLSVPLRVTCACNLQPFNMIEVIDHLEYTFSCHQSQPRSRLSLSYTNINSSSSLLHPLLFTFSFQLKTFLFQFVFCVQGEVSRRGDGYEKLDRDYLEPVQVSNVNNVHMDDIS